MKLKSDKLYWTNVLPENEICMLTILLYDFLEGRLDYKGFKDAVEEEGYAVSATVKKTRAQAMTVKTLNALKERIKNDELEYGDINNFILTDKDGREIAMRMDVKGIKLAANVGDVRAMTTMRAMRQAEYNILKGYLPSDKISNIEDFNTYMDRNYAPVGRAAR